MGLFGKSFEDQVQSALEKIRPQFPGSNISASVDHETVTLTGHASDLDTKSRIMAAFNQAIETKNTVNQITIDKSSNIGGPPLPNMTSAASPGLTAASEHRIHEVVSGDTLSALSKHYYGDSSKYNKIFEANRDQLNDPDKIRVGQKLKIPL